MRYFPALNMWLVADSIGSIRFFLTLVKQPWVRRHHLYRLDITEGIKVGLSWSMPRACRKMRAMYYFELRTLDLRNIEAFRSLAGIKCYLTMMKQLHTGLYQHKCSQQVKGSISFPLFDTTGPHLGYHLQFWAPQYKTKKPNNNNNNKI